MASCCTFIIRGQKDLKMHIYTVFCCNENRPVLVTIKEKLTEGNVYRDEMWTD